MNVSSGQTLLVLGASSGIGQALLADAATQGMQAIGVSRQTRPEDLDARVHWVQWQLEEPLSDSGLKAQMQQTEAVLQTLLPQLCQQYQPDVIISCQGLLQQERVKAEKSLRQLDISAALDSWWVNYLLPAIQIKSCYLICVSGQ